MKLKAFLLSNVYTILIIEKRALIMKMAKIE